jgi:hypothetical protein
LKDLRNNDAWFGGITVVFVGITFFFLITNCDIGDFRQCLPVVPKGSRGQITASAISNARFWKDVTAMRLTVNMRLLAQAGLMSLAQHMYPRQFADWLLQVGDGNVNGSDDVIPLPSGDLSLYDLFN